MKNIKTNLIKAFPQLKIYSLSRLGEGYNSMAILVNDSLVFKIPKHQKASTNLKREHQILDYLYLAM